MRIRGLPATVERPDTALVLVFQLAALFNNHRKMYNQLVKAAHGNRIFLSDGEALTRKAEKHLKHFVDFSMGVVREGLPRDIIRSASDNKENKFNNPLVD